MSSAGVTVLSLVRDEPVVFPNNLHSPLDMCSKESIVIYLSIAGLMTPMRVLESDSIESMKLRIQTCKGFVVKKQKLVCGGRELARSNSLLRDYGVANGNVLHLVLRLSDLQEIKVRTGCGKEFSFHVKRDRDVGYVKKRIAKKGKDFVDLEEEEVVCNGERLEDQRLIDDICKHNDAVIHLFVQKCAKVRARPIKNELELSIVAPVLNNERVDDIDSKNHGREYEANCYVVPRKPPDRDFSLEPLIVNPKIQLPSVIWDMVNSTCDGLDAGHYPLRSMEGTGGVYFMLDSLGQKHVSVFKPIDEEPMAVNNPRGLPASLNGEGLKKGTRVGEGAFREVAAYILDHPKGEHHSRFGREKGFAGVPPTFMVKCFHRGFNHPGDLTGKIGSLQMFMENSGSCEDMGPGAFPVKEVHKISVLDIRLANADRHAGNILLRKEGEVGQIKLIPIDHGYCLPETVRLLNFVYAFLSTTSSILLQFYLLYPPVIL